MSGGSFDYLYCKDAYQLMNKVNMVERMKEALSEYKEDSVAVKQTARILETLNKVHNMLSEVESHVQNLSPVWRAVEWDHSCDGSADDVQKEIEKLEKKKLELMNYWGA